MKRLYVTKGEYGDSSKLAIKIKNNDSIPASQKIFNLGTSTTVKCMDSSLLNYF